MVGHGGFWKLDRGSGITGVPSGGPRRSNNEDRVGRRPGHLLVKEEVIKGKRSLLGGGDCKGYTSQTGVRVSSDMGMAALTRTRLSQTGMVGHPAPTAHFQSPDLAIVRTFHGLWPRLYLFV